MGVPYGFWSWCTYLMDFGMGVLCGFWAANVKMTWQIHCYMKMFGITSLEISFHNFSVLSIATTH